MSTQPTPSAPVQGYLSEESKRRFTLVAGVLGAVFFLAQFVLPFLVFLLVFFPGMMLQEFRTVDMEEGAIWRGELWYVERVESLSFRDPQNQRPASRLRHASLANLTEAKDIVPLEAVDRWAGPSLLADGDRLWLLCEQGVAVYENGVLRRLQGAGLPRHASRPFLYHARPAVVTLGRDAKLAALHIDGEQAQWSGDPLMLDPPVVGEERVTDLQAVAIDSRLFLVAEVGEPESEARSLFTREAGDTTWMPLTTDCLRGGRWSAMAVGGKPGVLVAEREKGGGESLSILTQGPSGIPARTTLDALRTHQIMRRWSGFSDGNTLLLLSEGMPGSRHLVEVVGGQVTRRADVSGSFPFGGGMMAMMMLPQLMPLALSLALAFILTLQMRKHRVVEYEFEGKRRAFASLWQRALAQVADAIVLGAGMAVAGLWMWRRFSDVEALIEEQGPFFMFVMMGLMALGVVWMVGILAVFSFTEGRSGKTPGKWLLGIRVVGTDLRPCGFGRALIRNLLTFADGFFNFLVGILLVALTEQWQRLGDLAARTIVVVDEKPDASGAVYSAFAKPSPMGPTPPR